VTPVVINLYGRPGAGKGTLSDLLRDELGWAHLSLGNALKEWAARGETAEQRDLDARLREGQFASDEQASMCVNDFLTTAHGVKGIIVDGFPRTLSQLAVWRKLNIDSTGVLIECPPLVCQLRMASRAVCPACGRTQSGAGSACARCGTATIVRGDDTPEVQRKRMKIHVEVVEPTIAAWKQAGLPLITISNAGSEASFRERALRAISALAKAGRSQ